MTLLVPEFLPVDAYTFARLRRVFEAAAIQEGVYGAGDLKVTQRAAGADKSVDVAAGRAWVRGDDTARQGSYHCENDGVVNLAIADNTSGNPRIDQVILHVYDSSVIGGGTNAAVLEVLQGTPTAGATVDNRLGAAALPATAIRLADIPVASGFASITSAIIQDRRPWALGLRAQSTTPGQQSPTVTGSISSSTFVLPSMAISAEFSGAPVDVIFSGAFTVDTDLHYVGTKIALDAADVANTARTHTASGAGGSVAVGWSIPIVVPAGRHVIAIRWGSDGVATATGLLRQMVVREHLAAIVSVSQ